ncbi:MAG TPA: DNA recombination protein RmuC [Candidatus Saccharimonadales bacterium]|nr:DNA recombination protein RmuC [Candidatus Saccharimonadales bacterium]
MLIAVIVLGVLVLALLAVLLKQQMAPAADSQSALMLKQDLSKLSDDIIKLKDGLHLQINDRLDKNNVQMLKQFEQSTNIIKDVTQKLTALEKTNQQVGDIAGELKMLQNVLQNPKQRGNLGEIYLESVLENVLPPSVFQMQYGFENGETVDAVVFVDKKVIPIDSKFSLENYNRLVEAKTPEERTLYGGEFKKDLKKRIDETSKYIRPREKTMDFAFMFIPSEAIYYDLLINKVGLTNTSSRDLIEYAFRDKKVIIVSPTTLLAYLQTVLQGLRSLQIEEQAKDIQIRVGELGRHITTFESFMQKLGNSLGTSINHFNTAHKELKKIDKDVVKIAGESPGVEPLLLDRPNSDED